MGSIVVRAALEMGELPRLDRVVLMAPPNHGSPVAKFASPLLGWACQGISDLSSDSGSYVNTLSNKIGVPTLVIAARFDLLVPVSTTGLDNVENHVVLNATHNSLLFSKKAARLAALFLDSGRMTDV